MYAAESNKDAVAVHSCRRSFASPRNTHTKHPRVLKHLLDSCGADPGACDGVGYSPLAGASQHGYTACVKLLLRHGVANLGRNAYRDALTGVAMTGNVRMLRELVRADGGRHVAGAKTSLGMTALHFTAGYCHPRATALLLQAGADENAVDAHGETPFDVIDTKRSVNVRHGIGRRLVRRILSRGPAFRAMSWAWPALPCGEGGGGVPATAALPSSEVEVPAAAATVAAAAAAAAGDDSSEWEDSEAGFDEAFALATAAAWRLSVAVFRRPRDGAGSTAAHRVQAFSGLMR